MAPSGLHFDFYSLCFRVPDIYNVRSVHVLSSHLTLIKKKKKVGLRNAGIEEMLFVKLEKWQSKFVTWLVTGWGSDKSRHKTHKKTLPVKYCPHEAAQLSGIQK